MSEPDIELHNKVETPDSKGLSVVRELVVHQSVLDAMASHVGSDTTVENGGVMLGQVDEKTGTVTITGSIAAVGAVSRVASLTFTHETWDHISEVQEQSFPDTKMVGWYHSHPHFGIFLSDHDLFIHRNFFVEPWQVAYVIDPLLHQEGFFIWEDGDVARLSRWQVVSDGGSPEGHLGVQEPARGMVPPPPAAPPKRSGTITGMLAIGVVTLLIGGIGGWFVGNNREDKIVSAPAKLAQTSPSSTVTTMEIGWPASSIAAVSGGEANPFFVGPKWAGQPSNRIPIPVGFKPGALTALQQVPSASGRTNQQMVVVSADGRSIWRTDLRKAVALQPEQQPSGLAVFEDANGGQRIWISTAAGNALRLNLDNQDNPVDKKLDIGGGPHGLVSVTNGAIAVGGSKAVAFTSLGVNGNSIDLGSDPMIASSATHVWVAAQDPTDKSRRVLKLYDSQLRLDRSAGFPVGGIQLGADTQLAAVDDFVWVSSSRHKPIVRVSDDGSVLYSSYSPAAHSVRIVAFTPHSVAMFVPGQHTYSSLDLESPAVSAAPDTPEPTGVRTQHGPPSGPNSPRDSDSSG